jgi:hypothetical protein
MFRFSLAVCAVGLVLVGCGGGGAASSNPKVTIKWPDTTRNFEATPESRSARIILTEINNSTKTQTWVVRRPSGSEEMSQTYTAPNRTVNGDCYLTVEFDQQADGTGPTFARLTSRVEIQSDGTLTADGGFPFHELSVARESFLYMEIANDTLQVNQEEPLQIAAFLNESLGGALPVKALSVTVEGDAVTLNNGVLRGAREGRARITATFNKHKSTDVVTESRDILVVPSPVATRVYQDSTFSAVNNTEVKGDSLYFLGPIQNTALMKMRISDGQVTRIANGPYRAFALNPDGETAWFGDVAPDFKARFRKINLNTMEILTSVVADTTLGVNQIAVNPDNSNDFMASCGSSGFGDVVRYRNSSFSYERGADIRGISFVASNRVWGSRIGTSALSVVNIDLSSTSSNFTIGSEAISESTFDAPLISTFGTKAIRANTFNLFDVPMNKSIAYYSDPLLVGDTPSKTRTVTATDSVAGLLWVGMNVPGRTRGGYLVSASRTMVIRAIRSSDLSAVGSASIELPEGFIPVKMLRIGARGLVILSSSAVLVVDNAPGL